MHTMKIKADRFHEYEKKMDDMMSGSMKMECVPADMNGHAIFTGKNVDLKKVEKDIREVYDLTGEAGMKE